MYGKVIGGGIALGLGGWATYHLYQHHRKQARRALEQSQEIDHMVEEALSRIGGDEWVEEHRRVLVEAREVDELVRQVLREG